MGLRYLFATIFVLSTLAAAPAHANVDSDQSSSQQDGNYVDAARSAALGAISSFNEQDRAASAAAGAGAAGQGIYLNSAQAIVQFQRQYDAAGKLIDKLNLALNECIAAADAEIKAAKAALAQDEDDSGALAKLKKAEANKIECSEHLTPMIQAASQARADVQAAAQKAGFTFSAAAGSGRKGTIVASSPAGGTGGAAQTYVVPDVKPIDTTSLEFWSTGTGAYPGNSQSTQSMIDKSEDEAGLGKSIISLGIGVLATIGSYSMSSDEVMLGNYLRMRDLQRPAVTTVEAAPQISISGGK
jgi:hypothetical protein